MFRRGDDGESRDDDRRRMVATDLEARGIADPRVLEAMGTVRREAYVPEGQRRYAYSDRPLPIDCRQTISQPYIVALMAEAAEVEPTDRVLEIGTGSGYGAAVLAELGEHVVTVERHELLAETAARALAAESVGNVTVVAGDGTQGHAEAAPYDAIVVTAAGAEIPPALIEQLADGGRLVMPVGGVDDVQKLVRLRRSGDRFHRDDMGAVRFVPLVGDQ